MRRRVAAGEALQQCFEVERRTGEAGLQASDDLREPLRRDRLQQVVDRAFLERRDRILVVRGDEHDVGAVADRTRDLEAGHAGHADVEERDVGRPRIERGDGIAAVASLDRDRKLRPGFGEAALQLLAQQRLVFGDQRRGHQGAIRE